MCAKQQKKVAFVLLSDEVIKLINVTKNKKHKLLIKMLYSSGLRISECLKLKYSDLDLNKRIGIVKKGKGNKDRLFKLTTSVINDVIALKLNNFKELCDFYLFYSNHNCNKSITVRTAQKALKKSALLANISKNVFPHLLRSRFATHLIEKDVNINIVQKVFGNSRIQTTLNYIKSSKTIFDKYLN